jgi:hypothetical protein
MKARTYLPILIVAIAILTIMGGCATRKKAISDEDFVKVWSGTWVGTENNVIGIKFHKAIFHPDGSYDHYYEIKDTIFNSTTKFTFYEKWTDSKGNIWYKARWEISHCIEGYSMGKFSNSGNTYEEVWKFGDGPIEEWAPDDIRYFYLKWYRQE